MKTENICFIFALIVGFAGMAIFKAGVFYNLSIGLAVILILLSLFFEVRRKIKNVAQLIHDHQARK